jgi:hypothetical protein
VVGNDGVSNSLECRAGGTHCSKGSEHGLEGILVHGKYAMHGAAAGLLSEDGPPVTQGLDASVAGRAE